jgi:alpha-N-acetylglucosaminidase
MIMRGSIRQAAWLGVAIVAVTMGTGVSRASEPTTAAHDVLQRLIGPRAADFHLELDPTPAPTDVFDVSATGGTVTIRGNSTVALTRGAYTYLRQACHCMDGWEGSHLDLPATLPDLPATHVVAPFQLRQEYNVCTLGYSTAYWDWPQWEHELDWMALHGINMPLAEVATEAVWQKVWLDMGVTQAELDAYFTGPAYLPWHRMGNINGWGGPFPAGFLAKQVTLQKKIIVRMRELGMKPIAPAFAGFVPPGLHRARPDATLIPIAPWAGFSKKWGTFLLDPTSPLYPEIGRRFITEWERQFGKNQYFLADSFNELQVPVPADRPGRLAKLAQYGDAVYKSVVAGDPDATWVMQGWLFYNAAKFWDPESTAALLSKVPNDRMVILDLACDFGPTWPRQQAFFGKQWIYSVIHDFGGKTTIAGSLDFFAKTAAATLADPRHGNLVGAGISPEGIETNEAIYELATDAMWTREPIDLDTWMPDYCTSRYGGCPDDMKQAWQLFRKSAYSRDRHGARPGFQRRPTTKPVKWTELPDDSDAYKQGLRLFLNCGPALKGNALYRADAIDFTAQYVSSRIDAVVKAAVAAGDADAPRRDRDAAAALGLMDDLDALLAAHPIHRLDRWVNFARAWGDTPAESDYYESDAKHQITTWGGHIDYEYASKVWAGMVGGYYRGRWAGTFEQMRTGQPFNVKAWEQKWIDTPGVTIPTPPADPVAACDALVAKADALDAGK